MVKRMPVSGSKNRVKKSPKILKDPIKEFAESIKKDGIVEVLSLSDDDCLAHVKTHISTQSVTLDKILNGKGFPTGRVTEIYGPQHIGKSTLLDHAFAQVQSMDGVGILFDTETARDIKYTSSIGVDATKLQLIEFTKDELHIENVMNRLYATVEWWATNEPNTPVVIGWDALGGTSTKDALEKRLMGNEKMAGAAKILRTAARQLPSKLGNTKIAVIIINHTYDTIGGNFTMKQTYGGAGVRHLASIRLGLSHKSWITQGSDDKKKTTGRFVEANLVKNRLGTPFVKTKFAVIPGIGIDNTMTLFEVLKDIGYIVVRGSWGAVNIDGDVIKFQGMGGFVAKCRDNPEIFEKLVLAYNSMV